MLGSPYNVGGVYKNSLGNYTVNFQKALTDASYASSYALAGIGFAATGVNYPTSTTVQFYNTAGAAADFNTVSVITYGCNALLQGS